MKTQPITPAEIDFTDPAAPSAPAFQDVYHSHAGALEQARHVFLAGNSLPGRWAKKPRFVILETGFGLGNNFLATWQAWRQDPQRCQTLVFISIEKHPLRKDDLARVQRPPELAGLAQQLHEAWPPLTPNLHRLGFEGGRVQLLLGLGDVHLWMRELVAEVDAFYLDGFRPASNAEMWDKHLLKALARRAAPGATAASWSVAPQLREGLMAAGFSQERQRGFANKGGMCVARYEPRHQAQKPAGREALAPQAQHALILGAGLAGAACAWALAAQGIKSTLIDARPGPAQAASGNPGGLYHGTLNPDDGLHARFNRAAALATAQALRDLPPLPWRQQGLLRLEQARDLAQMQALLQRLGLPPDYVQALSQAEAAALSGLALPGPAWFYPAGGALPPPAYAQALLDAAGPAVDTRFNCRVARIDSLGSRWRLWDEAGRLIAETDLLVLAGGHEAQVLLAQLDPGLARRLSVMRGQLSHLSPAEPRPKLPVAGLGYAIADRAQGLWCGATSQLDDTEPRLRDADHQRNLGQWLSLSGQADSRATIQGGRVGWRLATPDRLPLVGGLPQPGYGGRQDQARFIPRRPGLALCTAMGSRGIAWAALCAQVLAAQISGTPMPLEASLLDAIDPARFLLRE
ncbi:tRNA 5-methylaminomethyl-2-thiouridine biosynthesis bifunctional protein [Paucibacter oligotrophus]|uniref:tRNA 5-methylaminomethyl-2-thiouridine biosynthesis bifunctional protein MnmC n=1 Tax=Roseateles oligotrophus TaxID=1769250 RepID=A0A840LBD3_9BURK|nr:FAD-dependent 5-carboxymethylaminomethyl-2-thiouridine(34) oxidoreductase MnmC [Roseateles oligotrophus]MBB4843962.1 tRNA 5-methylaminomethyl-2-thiouridine biosynthesis bifunctional protein [Roseateles oligotrophus]